MSGGRSIFGAAAIGAMNIAHYGTDLTDAQWALVKRCLPAAKRRGRPRASLRVIRTAILCLVKAGCPWRLRALARQTAGKRVRPAAAVLGTGDWLIGRDTRESGPALQDAFAAGLLAGGARPCPIGVAPTPAVAFLSAQRQLPAAMITASFLRMP